ncbi:NfeD family protein [Gracilibacillus sp. Marseille-QA3620]
MVNTLQDFFLYGVIISTALTFILVLFNDLFDGLLLPPFLNPVLVLAFFSIFCGIGYLFIAFTSMSPLLATIFSAIISFMIVAFIHVFILVPVSTAQESLVITEEDLKGRLGKVIISVPEDGFGEVLITSNSGSFSKPAVSFEKEPIPADAEVLIIDIQNGVLYVSPYENSNLG